MNEKLKEWVPLASSSGWIEWHGYIKPCPKCWEPLALVPNEQNHYTIDHRDKHVCKGWPGA